MDERGKCNRVKSVCIVNNWDAKLKIEDSITSNITAYKHLTTNLEGLQEKILHENDSRKELRCSSPNELRRSINVDRESGTKNVTNCWIKPGDTPVKDNEAKNLLGVSAQQ